MYVPGSAYTCDAVGDDVCVELPSPKLKLKLVEVSPFRNDAVNGTVVPAWVALNGTRSVMSCPAARFTQM